MSDLEKLPSDIDALLHAERADGAAPAHPAGARERVWTRVAATVGLALPSLVPAALPAVDAATRAAPGHATALKLGASFALGMLLAGGLFYASRARHADEPARASQPPVAVVAPASPPPAGLAAAPSVAPAVAPVAAPALAVVSPPPPPEPAVAPALRSSARVHAPRALAAAPITACDLGTERTLLDGAQSALGHGDARAALALVERHEHRCVGGQLVEERESLAVRGLAASGDPDGARARGERFRVRFPSSIFLPAVEHTLKSLR